MESGWQRFGVATAVGDALEQSGTDWWVIGFERRPRQSICVVLPCLRGGVFCRVVTGSSYHSSASGLNYEEAEKGYPFDDTLACEPERPATPIRVTRTAPAVDDHMLFADSLASEPGANHAMLHALKHIGLLSELSSPVLLIGTRAWIGFANY